MATTQYQYQVKANLLVAKLEGGAERYLDKGAFLPSNVTKDHREHLVKVGLVEKVKVEAPAADSDAEAKAAADAEAKAKADAEAAKK